MRKYAFGFVYSIILTLLAFGLVINKTLEGWGLLFVIISLASIQLAIQLIFFLHINEEKKPWLKQTTFWFAAGVVVIIVFGSLWIMINLNYHHGSQLSPDETRKKIQQDELINQQELR